MNLERLVSYYCEDPRTKLIEESTSQSTDSFSGESMPKIHLKGLAGSQIAFISAAIYKNLEHNHLFVAQDKESAAYLKNDIANLLEKKDVLFFPDSFKKPGHFDVINNTQVLSRTETVNKLANPNSKANIIVTYPSALFEKVVSPKQLKENTLYIKVKEKVDADFITEVLVEYNFEHVDFVYEPGQFSVRGDIIDIFSFANELPYRIELFDDEVESIRTFDPLTQLSQKKIASITIIPNIQTHFSADSKESILNILPTNTFIWCADIDSNIELLNEYENQAELFKESDAFEKSDVENHPFEDDLNKATITAKEFLASFEQFPIIEFQERAHYVKPFVIQYNTSAQPSFNKNFEMLIDNLKGNTKETIVNFIFAENPKQIERFYHIFDDLSKKNGEEGSDIDFHPINKSIHQGFIDKQIKLACYTDHQIFNRFHKYSLRKGYSRDKALLVKQLRQLTPGDLVTHIDHGVGTYKGLQKIEVRNKMQEAVRIEYAGGDMLYVNINSLHKITKYAGKDGVSPKINKLGSDAWANLKRKTKKKIKDIAADLIKLYAKRRSKQGFAFSPDSYLQTELEASFIYEDTPDQFKATVDTKTDMEKEMPMDRLVCGDVGFGKTEIAIRAAFKAVADSKQVAVLVPTTILAFQHFQTFKERLKEFPCRIDYINRFRTAKQKTEIFKELKEGKIDILIGTHSIVSKRVEFKDLGLMIIDEEQKFGVGVKEKLKQIKVNVDSLTLTATPIPRTLQFSLLGARDLSIINTPPPNRQPVTTEVAQFSPDIVKEAIDYEVYRGGQVFFVHNRVKDIADLKVMISKICPEVDVGVAHGQMEGSDLEDVMLRFVNREFDVLLCTNIIESGVDIPNANTIIINNANWFGLSDLHQLRGRVGRSNKKAFCYLFRPPISTLTKDARRRLKTIEEFAEIGSGFNIAMRDLDIRGAGNLLGGEQSGFISDIGFDMYHKILDEAIEELKETEFKGLYKEEIEAKKVYVRECQIDTDLEMLIPDHYVKNIDERLALYTELNNIKNEDDLQEYKTKLQDRFGEIPRQVDELFNAVRIKWMALRLGFERIIFKNDIVRCYFTSNQESPFYQSGTFGSILQYTQQHPSGVSLKQTDKHLIMTFKDVRDMQSALNQLTFVEQFGLESVQ